MTIHYLDFEVRGNGIFPADMLRYDACWPTSNIDIAKVVMQYEDGDIRTPRTVKLRTVCQTPGEVKKRFGITPARWESFGWRVQP